MKLFYLAFSEKGMALARRLAAALGGEAARCGPACPLAAWTAAHFAPGCGLVYIGAAGIAVRAAAPHLRGKAADPAVVAVDECARFAVPLLSGHLGGANDLARKIAAVCGAQAAVTTATDANGLFAVDAWARVQGCAAAEPERIKKISAALLAGGTLRLRMGFAAAGAPPAEVTLADTPPFDAELDVFAADPAALHLVPRVAVLGVGCRRGIEKETLERVFSEFCAQTRLLPQAVCLAASIDRKANEAGLLAFCAAHGWALQTFSADALRAVPGDFTPSDFVRGVTGVDNVCERAAAAAGGTLCRKKFARDGVTFALALRPFTPDWRWQNG